MLSNDNISDILKAARARHEDINEQDVSFLALCDTISDKAVAHRWAYGFEYSGDIDDYMQSARMTDLAGVMAPFGVGRRDLASISREENQAALIEMLADIQQARKNHEMDKGQALKMEADIRVKLQDKFDMDEDSDEVKHLIVVPQKHDYICPHTNRECTKMASKEACMKYYNLVEKKK